MALWYEENLILKCKINQAFFVENKTQINSIFMVAFVYKDLQSTCCGDTLATKAAIVMNYRFPTYNDCEEKAC